MLKPEAALELELPSFVHIIHMRPLTCSLVFLALSVTQALAWLLVERDGSIAVDVINLLRCLQANGYPNHTMIAAEENKILTVGINQLDESLNRTALSLATRFCYRYYGYGLSFSTEAYDEFPGDYLTPIASSTLEDAVTDGMDYEMFGRNRVIDINDIMGDSSLPSVPIGSTTDTHFGNTLFNMFTTLVSQFY